MPKVSVVVPAYNAEKYIQEAVDSILFQNFTDFELIIINDCSSDKTEEIIQSISDSRIIYLKNDVNMGVAETLNRGLDIAQGKYIARMDADDISLGNRLKIQADMLDNHSELAVIGSNVESFNETDIISTGWSSTDPSQMKVDLFFSCGLAHPSVMMRRDVIKELGGYNPDYNGLEDYELWCRVIEKYEITTLPDILLRYRIHGNQVTKNPSAEYRARMHNLKIRQLCQLGIDPLCSQAEVYYEFCEGKKPTSETDMLKLNDFFELAAEANAKSRFYDSEKLTATFKSVLIQNISKLPYRQQRAVVSHSKLINHYEMNRHVIKQKIKKIIGKN